MSSAVGLLLILLGGFIMAVSYGTISSCLSYYSNDPTCWNPLLIGRFGSGPFGFYFGAIIAMLGAVILVGRDLGRLLRKLRGARPSSEQ